jgi:hypothetical protein
MKETKEGGGEAILRTRQGFWLYTIKGDSNVRVQSSAQVKAMRCRNAIIGLRQDTASHFIFKGCYVLRIVARRGGKFGRETVAAPRSVDAVAADTTR